MAQSERNPQDNRYDPFTHMMFGSYLPPAGPPPQESYQTGESYTSGTPNQSQPAPGFMQHFLDKEGNIDFNKMMTSADQLMQVINKTAPMVKQLSPLLNFFKK